MTRVLSGMEDDRSFGANWLALRAALIFAVLFVAEAPSQLRAAESTPTFETADDVGNDAVQGTLPDEETQPEAAASQPTFETVDVPGAGTGALQGTLPRTIRNVTGSPPTLTEPSGIQFPGVIAGTYIDARSVYHGFYRVQDGRIFKFDAPGAGSAPGFGTGGYGVPVFPVKPNDFSGAYLNDRGGITGTYVDSTNHFHGFRFLQTYFTLGSTVRPLNVDGVGGAVDQGTIATGMSNAATSQDCTINCFAGYVIDSGYVSNAFFRFDAGGGLLGFNNMNFGGRGRGQGTFPLRLVVRPAFGEGGVPTTIGYTIDGANVYHGLTWYPPPSPLLFSEFSYNAPGAGTLPGQGTLNVAINTPPPSVRYPGGDFYDLAGYYIDAGGVSHGFARLVTESITYPATYASFDAPGAGTLAGQGTVPVDINRVVIASKATIGSVTGYYIDQQYVARGFVRHPDGTMETFDAPGACSNGFNALCQGKGTEPTGIGDSGQITGFYVDAKGVYHGFLRTP
ncbi:MAG: hypothetical protein ACLQAT_14645 [Candidatus Binataceae bacterium]